VALEEPGDDDIRLEVDGVSLSIPPDVGVVLRYYDAAELDHDPNWGQGSRFFVRFGRKAWGC
jgi:hypothetical protein